jgi:hypothetical protein
MMRIIRALRREGVVSFGILVLQRLAGYRAMLFFRNPRELECATPDPAVEEYARCEVRFNEMPWSSEAVSKRLHDGHRLFVLRVNDRLVSFAWVTEDRTFSIDELDAIVTVDRPMVWLWDCMTPAAFRGRGYYPRLLLGLVARFEAARTVIYCQPMNYPSLRGIQKAGFARWMSVTSTRWWIRVRRNGDFPGAMRVMRRVA